MPVLLDVTARVAELDRLLVDWDNWCEGYGAGLERRNKKVMDRSTIPLTRRVARAIVAETEKEGPL